MRALGASAGGRTGRRLPLTRVAGERVASGSFGRVRVTGAAGAVAALGALFLRGRQVEVRRLSHLERCAKTLAFKTFQSRPKLFTCKLL